MPSQKTALEPSSYSLTKDRERRSTQGNRPEHAKEAFALMDKRKEKQAIAESQKEVSAEIAARPQPDDASYSAWPVYQKPKATADDKADKKAIAHALAKYHCQVIAYRTGINVYPRYQLGELSAAEAKRIAFPDGVIYNAKRPSAHLDLRDNLPAQLTKIAKTLGQGEAGYGSKTKQALSAPNRQLMGSSQANPSRPSGGPQPTRGGTAIVTNPDGANMYPGITRGHGVPQEVQSRFVKQTAKRGSGTIASTGSQATSQATKLGYVPLSPTDSRTLARGNPARSRAPAVYSQPTSGKAPRIDLAKQQRKRFAAVDQPPSTSTSSRALAAQGRNTDGVAPPRAEMAPLDHNQAPRESFTAKASAAPKPDDGSSRIYPMATPRAGGRPTTRTANPNPKAVASANNQIRGQVVRIGGNGIDNRNSSVSASASLVHSGQQREWSNNQSHRLDGSQIVQPGVAEGHNEPDGVGDEPDEEIEDMEVGDDEDMPIDLADARAPPRHTIRARAWSEMIKDEKTGREVRKIHVNPDTFPANFTVISAYDPILQDPLRLLVKIVKPVLIAYGTYEMETPKRTERVKCISTIMLDGWYDVQTKLNIDLAYDYRYLAVVAPQMTSFRYRTFKILEKVAGDFLGFDFKVNDTDDEGRKRNLQLYERYKNFGFIFAFPDRDGQPFNSKYILEAVLATAYATKRSYGYKERDLFSSLPNRFVAFICTLTFRMVSLFKNGAYPTDSELDESREKSIFSYAMRYVEKMEEEKAADWHEIKAKIAKAADQKLNKGKEAPPPSPPRNWSPDGSLRRNVCYVSIWDDERARARTPIVVDDKIIEHPPYDDDVQEVDLGGYTIGHPPRSPAGDYGSDGVLLPDDEDEDMVAYRVPSPLPEQGDFVGSPPEEMMEEDDEVATGLF